MTTNTKELSMEKKDIRQYLHYYLGCECKMIKSDDSGEFNLTPHTYSQIFLPGSPECIKNAKPNLRKLSSMTEEEAGESGVGTIARDLGMFNRNWSVKQFHYLISKGFWLFGDDWFDEGIIIDKQTLNP